MNSFLRQIILAARNSDSERTGWIQTLFFIILAVFYVVGSILKARANKLEKEKPERQKPGRKLPKTTPEIPKFLQKILYPQEQPPAGRTPEERQPRPQARPPRRKLARPQPVGQGLPTKAEQVIEPPTLEPLEVAKVAPPKPQLQPEFEELPEFTAEVALAIPATVKKLQDRRRAAIPVETPQAEFLSEPLLDYEDPEKLRRAILHYEILGKPLSLRGPSEHIIGL